MVVSLRSAPSRGVVNSARWIVAAAAVHVHVVTQVHGAVGFADEGDRE